MNNNPIGIFDSGIGGISILNKVLKYLPNEDYIYYADSIHNPYGNKSKEELIQLVDGIMKKFMLYQVKLVIVACNTATTQVISYLRKRYYNILFVGVEPAIKVAYDYHRNKNVLIMATPGTIQSKRLLELNQIYSQEKRVLLSCDGLAELIENDNMEAIPSYLISLFSQLDKEKIDVVVLGCTHYPFIKKEIIEVIGHSVIFLDPSVGVSLRVKHLLKENGLEAEGKEGKVTFLLTDPSKESVISKYLDLEDSYVLSSVGE